MPATYSGRLVSRESGYPSLLDIAVGLSRQPRFAGQTVRWWSVLDHTLFGHELVLQRLKDGVPVVGSDEEESHRLTQVVWLLHDAHEAITGDMASDIKTPDVKLLQAILDDRIYGNFASGTRTESVRRLIKEIDGLTLVAEARVVGNPLARERVGQRIVGEAVNDAASLLISLLNRPNNWRHLGIPPREVREGELGQEKHPAVEFYLDLMARLL
jgi:hypothetical protein